VIAENEQLMYHNFTICLYKTANNLVESTKYWFFYLYKKSMDIQKLGLKETLEALRVELSESILVSEGKEIRFEMGEIELEM